LNSTPGATEHDISFHANSSSSSSRLISCGRFWCISRAVTRPHYKVGTTGRGACPQHIQRHISFPHSPQHPPLHECFECEIFTPHITFLSFPLPRSHSLALRHHAIDTPTDLPFWPALLSGPPFPPAFPVRLPSGPSIRPSPFTRGRKGLGRRRRGRLPGRSRRGAGSGACRGGAG